MICFTHLTRSQGIGSNCYFLELDERSLVLDAGMDPKSEGMDSTPLLEKIAACHVDGIYLSHPHLDHLGCIPVVQSQHPEAFVFMSETTAEVGSAMLHNSVNVMSRQREELGIRDYPLFTHRQAERMTAEWEVRPLRKPFTLDGERASGTDETTLELFEAGHIVGATALLVTHRGRRILYTGDVNTLNQNIARKAELPTKDIDTLIIECTRGDTPTDPEWTRAREIERLLTAIDEVFEAGGCVLIPVFALGKTQEVLGMIYEARKQGRIREYPVYIGGLSTKISEILDGLASKSPRRHQGLKLLPEVRPFALNGKDIGSAPIRSGRLYLLSSGMMTENTLSHVFAQRMCDDPKNGIFFVGYADPDSTGGKIKAAGQGGRVSFTEKGAEREIASRVESFNFSAHASREDLLAFINEVSPKQLILVHGDPAAVAWFANNARETLPDCKVICPQPGEKHWIDE
ncbi:MAG: MBL fold metallo-hydrolase [Verrucomicrobiales bacterium]